MALDARNHDEFEAAVQMVLANHAEDGTVLRVLISHGWGSSVQHGSIATTKEDAPRVFGDDGRHVGCRLSAARP